MPVLYSLHGQLVSREEYEAVHNPKPVLVEKEPEPKTEPAVEVQPEVKKKKGAKNAKLG